MKKTPRLLVVLGALSSGGLVTGLIAVGCGSSSSNGPPTDGGGDGTTDGFVVGEDTGSDIGTGGNEAGTGPETGVVPDTGIGNETGAADAGHDADAGTGNETSADAAPLADAEAGPDSAALLAAFPAQVATALCNRFSVCCGTSANFDTSACVAEYTGTGYAGSSVGLGALANGNVAYNAAEAQTCLNLIAAVDCTDNTRTSAEQTAIVTACFAAMTGKLGVGQPCQGSIECSPGEFCNPSDGGTAGLCASLRTAGQPCNDFGSNQAAVVPSQAECSYRGSGTNGLTCLAENFVSGDLQAAGTWQCVQQLGQDAAPCVAGGPASCCNFNTDCQSLLCDPGPTGNLYVCATSETFIYPEVCQVFQLDGGG
jgi:hypothetical protein